jgi:LDH2 family malate/lactate/ureidoglycolate dehydrogenase
MARGPDPVTRARKRAPRYRLDDLRRFAAALGAGVGLAAEPATGLATHLLWFDAAGAPRHGLATLPGWLERIERRQVDPGAQGQIGLEHAATAVLDGQGGLAPLILARAAGVAGEKARDTGLGLVRVTGLGPSGPAAPIAAELAIGPQVGLVLGPGPDQALALPSAEGLPLVIDSALDQRPEIPAPPVSGLIAPERAIVVVAVAVTALESLATFHERLGAALKVLDDAPGRLLPGPWDDRRRAVRERGVPLDAEAMAALRRWADRLEIEPPAPWTT